jgi:hypothetical protein
MLEPRFPVCILFAADAVIYDRAFYDRLWTQLAFRPMVWRMINAIAVRKRLGNQVRALRKKHGWSQEELAHRGGARLSLAKKTCGLRRWSNWRTRSRFESGSCFGASRVHRARVMLPIRSGLQVGWLRPS